MNNESEIRSIISEFRVLTDQLERLVNDDSDGTAGRDLPIFDPDVDDPPLTPKVDGNIRAQQDWCALLLWAKLRSINKRQHRGATHEEVVEIAKAAGYQDGRGWNRWYGWNEEADGRWFTKDKDGHETGMDHLRTYYERVGRSIPADLV